jgi:hypothetical protein
MRDKIRKKYGDWPTPSPAIGRMANFSSLKRYRPKEYKIYDSFFDRRDALPRFVLRPRNQNALENESAEFRCTIIAVSPPVVSWYVHGSEIKQSIKHFKKYRNNTYNLEVKRCSPVDDVGEYIVKAVNSYGEKEYNVYLTVEPLPKVKEIEKVEIETSKHAVQQMEFDLWQEPDNAARFTFLLRPRLIQVGIGCKLLCCLSGKPAPTVQWFKGSKEIAETDSHYSLDYGCGVCTLEIASCTLADAGTYKCRAENSLGSDETSCHVNVEGKFKKFLKILKNSLFLTLHSQRLS